MQYHLGARAIHYWRTKQGAEIDFVLVPRGARRASATCGSPEGAEQAASTI